MYITRFEFPDSETEASFRMGLHRTCYDSIYPFNILCRRELTRLEFEPITILYGLNGSGKTTALNVIAEKLNLARDTLYNRSGFFEDYTRLCRYEARAGIPPDSRIITSDDVFDYMLNIRMLNNGIDMKRDELFEDYLDDKHAKFQLKSLDDYEKLRRVNLARRKTQSKYVRERLMDNVREQSNGESAYFYFTSKIQDDGLYLLDEPENSLAPARQQELAEYLVNMARFFGCQLIISTHSPFLLAMDGARVYDLDADPVKPARWTELDSVKAYHDFFKRHERAFD